MLINYLDLFSGAGGFAKGLLAAGFSFKHHYCSEIDKFATANYKYRFPKAEALGDIKKINGKKLSKIDLITFGSPCQDVSLIGKRTGLKGRRSHLFFEAVRLITECVPSAFIFENVQGLLSANKGKDFATVLQTFADIGLYNCQWQLLNTRWFLPQNRERVYVVGTHREKAAPKIFPFGKNNSQTDISSTEQKIIVPTFTTSVGKLTNSDTYILHNSNRVRKLTPIECERLQGFPDEWTRFGIFDNRIEQINDNHRYHLIGNAVSVPVVKAVSQRLNQSFR